MSTIETHGLVQGDVHPTNIMFGQDETPVLIDFDSCFKIGELVIGKGAHEGWAKKVKDPLALMSYRIVQWLL